MSDTFKVFAVDDDPFVLDIIRGVLQPAYAVETFGSTAACLQRLDTEQPGMFLLDVRMPGMDGYALCRGIKDDAGWRRIPVTFVSGQDTIDARLKGYDAGGEDFIVKPFEAEEANQRNQTGIEAALERIRAITARAHQAHLRDRAASSELLVKLEQSLASAFVHLGLSEDQEQRLGDLVHGFMQELMELLDRGEGTHESLHDVSERLGQLTAGNSRKGSPT